LKIFFFFLFIFLEKFLACRKTKEKKNGNEASIYQELRTRTKIVPKKKRTYGPKFKTSEKSDRIYIVTIYMMIIIVGT